MRTTSLIHGGRETRIRLFDPPPPRFDPLTVSAEDLALYGFPERPGSGPGLARYQQIFTQLKGKHRIISPEFVEKKSRTRRKLRRAPGLSATEASGNWSGATLYAGPSPSQSGPPNGQQLSVITASWVLPSVAAQAGEFAVSTWVGLDGDDDVADVDADVVQAGFSYENGIGGPSLKWFAWWEWYPAGAWIINDPKTSQAMVFSPGDTVTVQVSLGGYTTFGAPTGDGVFTNATVYVANNSTGATTSFEITPPPETLAAGACAEWVVEAPTYQEQPLPLPDYTAVNFTGCCATLYGTNKKTNPGSGGNNTSTNVINMYNASGDEVSQGQLVGASGVECTYITPPSKVATQGKA